MNGSPVGVTTAARMTTATMAMRRFFLSVSVLTTPTSWRKTNTSGSSAAMPNASNVLMKNET